MDIGKFKSSRLRLTLWILVPPLLIVGVGLSSYALQLQSEWQLNRTKTMAEVLPKLAQAESDVVALLEQIDTPESRVISSEDGLISFIQSTAQRVDFTVDSLKVERQAPGKASGLDLPLLTANVTGSGNIEAIQLFLADVGAAHQLLSESELQVSQQSNGLDALNCRAEITFDLVLFETKVDAGRKE